MTWVPTAAGLVLLLLALLDVFLVVLYLRSGVGLVSPLLSAATWRFFRGLARLLPHARGWLLSLTGPVLLVVTALTWGMLVVLGCALLAWPWLGEAVRAASGPTPDGFGTALYYAAMSLTTLGTGDLVAHTVPARLAMVAMAGLGFSLLTMVMTYFLSIYSALLRRNTFAIDLHHRTASTGDAAEYLARTLADGDASPALGDLRQMGQELVHLFESHQFYPLLHYFRYPQERYALARIGLVVLDTYSLIQTALDREAYPTLVRGSAARGLWEAGRDVLAGLGQDFLDSPRSPDLQDEADRTGRWRSRYRDARERLAQEGLQLAPAAEGERAYLALRRQWEPWVEAFAIRMGYDMKRILVESGSDRLIERDGDRAS